MSSYFIALIDIYDQEKYKQKTHCSRSGQYYWKPLWELFPHKKTFTKACSVNTIYFWEEPKHTVEKVANLLQPGGRFVLAFEDIQQLERRKLSRDVFRLYTEGDVTRLLASGGFRKSVRLDTRKRRNLRFHCAVATK